MIEHTILTHFIASIPAGFIALVAFNLIITVLRVKSIGKLTVFGLLQVIAGVALTVFFASEFSIFSSLAEIVFPIETCTSILGIICI